MKRFLLPLLMLVVGMTIFTGCSKTDDELIEKVDKDFLFAWSELSYTNRQATVDALDALLKQKDTDNVFLVPVDSWLRVDLATANDYAATLKAMHQLEQERVTGRGVINAYAMSQGEIIYLGNINLPVTIWNFTVGQTTHTGGIVFYDKGVVSDGWRFMEIAPNNIGPHAWANPTFTVAGTLIAIGTGRENTTLIVQRMTELGLTTSAAALCANFATQFTGAGDWYLPSQDELNQMYTTLRVPNIGNLTSGWYWSSTQCPTDPNSAIEQDFSTGVARPFVKTSSNPIRPVRRY